MPIFESCTAFTERLLYRRIDCGHWKSIFTFKNGCINHIHNIIPDEYNECVWVLTGDFDNAAAIWRATNNFEIVEKITGGDQNSRSCVAFPVNGKLLYATDTPFYSNSIRLLEKSQNGWSSKKLTDIAGSCIYGCKVGTDFVFSTTVEPDGRDSISLFSFFKSKRGCGIKDNYSHLYVGNIESGFKDIYKAKKDFLPPFLFQFGTLKFPSGTNNTNTILVEHIATKKHDCLTIKIEIK